MANVFSDPERHVILQNNVKMPILGLGTSHNGGYCHEAVVHALAECGYRHIDTAKRYGCEKFIAQAIQVSNVDREELFLTTKCWPTDYGKTKIKAAVEGSCQRLGTDYLDLYLLHWPEVPTGYNRKELIAESWRALEVLYDQDIIRAIGVSNFLVPHLEELIEDATVIPHVNQCEFHPFNNPIPLRQMCADNHIQFEGYSPLAKSRILSSPIVANIAKSCRKSPAQILIKWCVQNGIPTIPKSTLPHRVFENSQGHSPLANGAVLLNSTIASIAKKLNKTSSQIVFKWNIKNQVVCIPKSTKTLRVKENSEIFDFHLNDEEMRTLDSLPHSITLIDRLSVQIFDFDLNDEEMRILDALPQCLTVIDRSSIQEKIDNPKPDGYKLKIIK